MADEARLTPRDRGALMVRLESAWSELEALLADAPIEILDVSARDGDWTVKDHLAHLATWAQVALSRTAGGYSATAEAPLFGLDADGYRATNGETLNQIGWQRHRDLSIDEIVGRLRATHARLVTAVAALGEDQLARPWLPVHPERGSLIDNLSGNTYQHYREHVAEIRRLLGWA